MREAEKRRGQRVGEESNHVLCIHTLEDPTEALRHQWGESLEGGRRERAHFLSVSFSCETEIMKKSVPHHQPSPSPSMLHPRTLYIL